MTEDPFLTIGMATYNDPILWATVTDLMIQHAEVMDQCEIVVIDNLPSSRQGKKNEKWVKGQPGCRYIPFPEPKGTAQPREQVFRHARGEFVLCIDSHVIIPHGSIARLIDFYKANRQTRNLYSGPLLKESGRIADTHQRDQWSKGARGVWSNFPDKRGHHVDDEPFEIFQQGMGLFTCRRDAWVGFHPQMRGFGGCETYIMESFRKRGDKVICLPFLRWAHQFFYHKAEKRPPANESDKFRNYIIGFADLGQSLEPVCDHFGRSLKDAQRILNESADPKKHTPQSKPLAAEGGAGPGTGRPKSAPPSLFAVIGHRNYGGTKLRGIPLAQRLGCKLLQPSQVPGMGNRQTIIAIKDVPIQVRDKCERLIMDPLDSFWAHPHVDPEAYWLELWEKYRFDEIIATSPACAETMKAALPASVPVHLIPHPCDPNVGPDWRDPKGPVVYSGLEIFIRSKRREIERACKIVKRSFSWSPSQNVLKGAAVALALRCAPYDTPVFQNCKPGIKLENAAAAGVPCISTDDPCASSLKPTYTFLPSDFSAEQLAQAIERALAAEPAERAFRQEDFLRAMEAVINVKQEAAA